MKKRIDIERWERKGLYRFFSQFEEPFFGITFRVDCTIAYQVENFRYRIIDGEVYIFDKVNASPTINRSNGTFGFAYIDYEEDEEIFNSKALKEIARVQSSLHAHHGLMDGLHAGQFKERFQELLNEDQIK